MNRYGRTTHYREQDRSLMAEQRRWEAETESEKRARLYIGSQAAADKLARRIREQREDNREQDLETPDQD